MVLIDNIREDLSGTPQMKFFAKYINDQLEQLYPDTTIKIKAKGQPYMLNLVFWEVKTSGIDYSFETEKTNWEITLDLVMYPAGFYMRFHEVTDNKETIVLKIKESIDIFIKKHLKK